MRTAVLTVSTSVSRREAEDESGPALAALAEAAGCEVAAMEVVPDDFALIEDRLHHFIATGCDLVFTTGGTGFTPNDVTPEATRAVILNEARGWAKATLPTYQDRKAFFERIVNGDPDPVELLRAGDEPAVRELIAAAKRAHAPAAA